MGFWSDTIHTGLDLAGMVPVIGEVADLTNAGLYALEGDAINAGISLAGCIPGVGQAATGARVAGKVAKEVAEKAAKEAAEKAAKEAAEKAAKEAAEKAAKEGAEAGAKNVGTKVSKNPTYDRPSGFRKGVREEAWEKAKGKDGKVRDPMTQKEMSPDEPWDMGHKPGQEFRKHQESAAQRGIDRKQFLDEHNNPGKYQPELPSSNRSHRGEDMTDTYLGP